MGIKISDEAKKKMFEDRMANDKENSQKQLDAVHALMGKSGSNEPQEKEPQMTQKRQKRSEKGRATLAVYLSADLDRDFTAYAESRGQSKSTAARTLIIDCVEEFRRKRRQSENDA